MYALFVVMLLYVNKVTRGIWLRTLESVLTNVNIVVRPFLSNILLNVMCLVVIQKLSVRYRNYPAYYADRRFKCDKCSYSTNVKCSLKRHMMVHTGRRPYHCLLCHKGFIQRSDLNIHMLRHTGEKPFGCELCSKMYSRRTQLRRHILVAHMQ